MLKQVRGSLAAQPVGNNLGHGKLEPFKDWLKARVESQADITLDQLTRELEEQFDVRFHHLWIGRVLHGLGLSHKKRRFTPKNSTELI